MYAYRIYKEENINTNRYFNYLPIIFSGVYISLFHIRILILVQTDL